MKLLTRANTKTIKGKRRGFSTNILHLAPAKLSGYEVCGGRSDQCTILCLNKAGRGKFNNVQQARIRKTKWFFESRLTFMAQLVKDIAAAIRYAHRHNLVVAIRLNGTSDIPWESIKCGAFKNIMARFPTVQFYDYSKVAGRKNIPSNYHLTFSASESNQSQVTQALANGMNVAVVFDQIPDVYMGLPVVNGDEDDLRFLDPKGHIVGLKAKGPALKSSSTFIVRKSNATRSIRDFGEQPLQRFDYRNSLTHSRQSGSQHQRMANC